MNKIYQNLPQSLMGRLGKQGEFLRSLMNRLLDIPLTTPLDAGQSLRAQLYNGLTD